MHVVIIILLLIGLALPKPSTANEPAQDCLPWQALSHCLCLPPVHAHMHTSQAHLCGPHTPWAHAYKGGTCYYHE